MHDSSLFSGNHHLLIEEKNIPPASIMSTCQVVWLSPAPTSNLSLSCHIPRNPIVVGVACAVAVIFPHAHDGSTLCLNLCRPYVALREDGMTSNCKIIGHFSMKIVILQGEFFIISAFSIECYQQTPGSNSTQHHPSSWPFALNSTF